MELSCNSNLYLGKTKTFPSWLCRFWSEEWKSAPFCTMLQHLSAEFPDTECLVWLNSEVLF
jgi:hypothetical protein